MPATQPMPTNLPPTDRALVAAAEKGEVYWPSGKRPSPEQLADADYVARMPTIRAATLRALCLGLWEGVRLDPRGIQLVGARIEGKLDLSFATVPVPIALFACHFADRLDLQAARLTHLDLSGSRLVEGLRADRVQIDGPLFCKDGFTARGEIYLSSARISGNVEFVGASLTVDSKWALCAGGLQVGGSLACGEEFTINGDTTLVAATIKFVMYWRPKDWKGALDLRHARVGQWADGWTVVGSREEWRWGRPKITCGWGCGGTPIIDLGDFAFESFLADDDVTTDAEARLAWLADGLKGQYVPGPYEQLSKVLRAAGDLEGANRVALEKRRARTRHVAAQKTLWVARWWERAWGWFLDATIRYGFAPGRGAVILIGLWLAGVGIFGVAGPTAWDGNGIIKPAIPMVYAQALDRTLDGQPIAASHEPTHHGVKYKLPLEYPPFNAVWYSFDTLIPLIDLGQGSAWSPSPIGGLFRDPAGWLVTVYQYIHIIAGWVLSTLTVVALTGLIKKD